MQLLDEHHLFIKYTSEEVVTLRVTDPSQVETHTHTHTWIPSLCCLCCSPVSLVPVVVGAAWQKFFSQSLQGRVSPSDAVQACDSFVAATNRCN